MLSINLPSLPYLNQDFWLMRFVFMRSIGLIYFVAFLSLFNQFRGLLGSKGLLPATQFIQRMLMEHGLFKSFIKLPSIFFVNSSDTFMLSMGFLGLALSLGVVLGLSNGASMLVLWILYMSFTNVGQIFYGYGWEMMLLEVGFLSIFLYPFLNLSFFPANYPPPKIIIFLLLWVLFRNMLGSGLIKLRGDSSWKDLTALFYHFETQPIPNPLSPFFHFMPKWMLKGGVLFNHFVEIVVPFMFFGSRIFRVWGGGFTVVFQIILILSGNLSFLNYLTLVMCIPCFDDKIWAKVLPDGLIKYVPTTPLPTAFPAQLMLYLVLALVAYLSINPIKNLLSSRQAMNRGYDPFHLVNTYGAFGHIGKTRNEIVISGTHDEVITADTRWEEYEFYAKPTNPKRRPPIVSPYHRRLDWQIWFAAMGNYAQNPWLIEMIYRLLKNDPTTLNLIQKNPFPDFPPRHIKIDLYQYSLAIPFNSEKVWWKRQFVRPYLPALNLNNPHLLQFIRDKNEV